MAGRKNGLGRGLDAFFPDRTSVVKEPARKTITKTVKTEKKSDVAEKQTNPTVAKKQTADSKTGAMIVKISSVEPNMDQPRKQFDEDALMELSESIKQYGVLHPLLVSDKKDYYEIIAGERRVRASKLAGKTTIPAIIRTFTDEQMMEIALLENLQRENLNAMEEAKAYELMLNNLHLTQEELAKKVGKSRSHITNMLGLLKLPDDVQNLVVSNDISMGHARVLSKLSDEEEIKKLANEIVEKKMPVRDIEKITSDKSIEKKVKINRQDSNDEYKYIEELMSEKLDSKVKVRNHKIEISFSNTADLNRILEIINIGE